jgi:hypothetical protein
MKMRSAAWSSTVRHHVNRDSSRSTAEFGSALWLLVASVGLCLVGIEEEEVWDVLDGLDVGICGVYDCFGYGAGGDGSGGHSGIAEC